VHCRRLIGFAGLEARTEVSEEKAAQVSSMPSVQITKSISAKSSALPVSFSAPLLAELDLGTLKIVLQLRARIVKQHTNPFNFFFLLCFYRLSKQISYLIT